MPRAFWALWTAQLVAALGFGAILPTLPLFLLAHGVPLTWLGGMVAVYSVAAFLAQMLAGRYSDRVGRRRVLVGGLAVATAAMAGFLLPGSTGLYLTLRGVWGLGAGAVAPVAMAAVADLVPDGLRGRAYGLLGTAGTIGTAVGPLVGAVAARWSLAGPFVAAVPLTILGLLLVWQSLPRETHATLPDSAVQPLTGMPGGWRPWFVPLLVSFGWMGLFGMYDTTWSVYLARLGASPALIGLSWTLFSLPLVVFSLVGGTLADARMGRRRGLVVAGIAVNAVLVYAYSLVGSYGPAVTVSVAEAFAIGVIGPSFQSLVMDGVPPDRRGAVQGVVQGAGTLGQLVLALISGALLPLSVRDPFRLGAAVLAGTAIVAGWRWRPDRRVEPTTGL